MKTFVVCVMSLCCLITNAQSIGLRAGLSLTPADYLSLRYEHWTNGAINLAGTVFYERSHESGLNYLCYGIDVLGEYAANGQDVSEHLFGWRAGLGASIQRETEPWSLKNTSFSKNLNYGFVGEGAIECYLTEAFRLSVFAQQKLLLRSSLGVTRFVFGLGLTYHFFN